MVPTNSILSTPIEEVEIPSKSYRINTTANQLAGYVDDIEAVMQAAYLILNAERYQFPIYTWDYGVELLDLFGQPVSYVVSELERRIKEALTQDDRITEVTDFDFNIVGSVIRVTFVINCEFGSESMEIEFDQGGTVSGV